MKRALLILLLGSPLFAQAPGPAGPGFPWIRGSGTTANAPTTCVVFRDMYYATDTQSMGWCIANGVWLYLDGTYTSGGTLVNGLETSPQATGTPVLLTSNVPGADPIADINVTCKGTGCAVIIPNAIYNYGGNITVAQVNAGQNLVPAVTGHTLKIVHFYLAARGGAAATCTDVRLGDSNNANAIVIDPVANLTQNAGNTEGTSSIAQSGFGATAFAAGLGINIFKTGSACATVTSFDVQVAYTVNY